MFIAIGLLLSALAYFVTDEGVRSVAIIMLCAVVWQVYIAKKKT
ncbi:hypothetical protein TUM18780_50260 (plasmid) [Escherichia coli]|uniref:Amino acid permease n=1 Tax=Escherichia coli TaxID=562 RepID=A0ABC8EB15_ECOLX|nr:hypothetical protein P804_05030 [Escherichia coli BIDMC 43b]ETX80456.1 hypothetical protein P803_05090 [Escherichia coli BIDMC 43a]BCG39864.1 hypothetical protein TUM18780_50260 [Escherichia coli]